MIVRGIFIFYKNALSRVKKKFTTYVCGILSRLKSHSDSDQKQPYSESLIHRNRRFLATHFGGRRVSR